MSERIAWLDGWRGLVCWLMLVYHLLFDLVMFGWMPYAALQSTPLYLLERFIAWSFILLAGVSAEFSHSNLRRGLITSAAGLLVTAVSYLVNAPIKFGVLQFLGIAMLLYAAAGKYLRRIPGKIAVPLWIVLYQLGWLVQNRLTVSLPWLFWLGLHRADFVSYDYFPLLPYLFMFLLGACFGRWLKQNPDKIGAQLRVPAVLRAPGRHTLLIYLAHQPVLYGACMLIYLAIN